MIEALKAICIWLSLNAMAPLVVIITGLCSLWYMSAGSHWRETPVCSGWDFLIGIWGAASLFSWLFVIMFQRDFFCWISNKFLGR